MKADEAALRKDRNAWTLKSKRETERHTKNTSAKFSESHTEISNDRKTSHWSESLGKIRSERNEPMPSLAPA